MSDRPEGGYSSSIHLGREWWEQRRREEFARGGILRGPMPYRWWEGPPERITPLTAIPGHAERLEAMNRVQRDLVDDGALLAWRLRRVLNIMPRYRYRQTKYGRRPVADPITRGAAREIRK